MTREEYLSALKVEIMSLTTEEQQEALQYYSDYFDAANDDEKIINELGEPKELAKEIIEKFANVPVKTSSTQNNENNSSVNEQNGSLFFEFEPSRVKNLNCRFEASEVVFISGNTFSFETRGISLENFVCHLSSDGTLTVNNRKKIYIEGFWNHGKKSRIIPRILVTVPHDFNLNSLKIAIGAGSIITKSIKLNCESASFDVGAGNLVLDSISGGKISFRCGMGNLSFTGKLAEQCNIDCGMGNINLSLVGNPEDYSYDVKLGLGVFKINEEKKVGAGRYQSQNSKSNHFSANVGMGNLTITLK